MIDAQTDANIAELRSRLAFLTEHLRAEFRNRAVRGDHPFSTDEESLLFTAVFEEDEQRELFREMDAALKRHRAAGLKV